MLSPRNYRLFQVHYTWFLQYLPSYKKLLEELKNVCNRLHTYINERVHERKEIMQTGKDSTDFISMYLREVEKSGGKLEDRYFDKCICSNKVLEYILIVIFYRFTSFYFHSLTVRSLLNNLR